MWRMAVLLSAVVLACGCTAAMPPSASDGIGADWDSIGSFKLHAEGDDTTARLLISSSGWRVYQGHNGGAGDTLQIIDPAGGIVLIWANNSFSGFIVSDGWTGTTSGGATIGTSAASFAQLHPEFNRTSEGLFELQQEGIAIRVVFDGGLLSRISVIDY